MATVTLKMGRGFPETYWPLPDPAKKVAWEKIDYIRDCVSKGRTPPESKPILPAAHLYRLNYQVDKDIYYLTYAVPEDGLLVVTTLGNWDEQKSEYWADRLRAITR
jgi:hypothetical protein